MNQYAKARWLGNQTKHKTRHRGKDRKATFKEILSIIEHEDLRRIFSSYCHGIPSSLKEVKLYLDMLRTKADTLVWRQSLNKESNWGNGETGMWEILRRNIKNKLCSFAMGSKRTSLK